MSKEIRVRFAPSPTGFLHIGGARTALYNWAYAQRLGGTFILRIEDTDQERSTPENTAQIVSSLKWLGLTWDEGPEMGGAFGPYIQSERAPLYSEVLEQLKQTQKVYPCFCTPELLNEKREIAQAEKRYTGYDRSCRDLSEAEVEQLTLAGTPHVWRLKLPLERESVDFEDAVFGPISVPMSQLDDFIILRTDGTPTYNYVVCVDDVLMQISHVIRGDDHLSNTPKQIMVYEAMGAPLPVFAHLSMILGSDGKRLSKRHGATSVDTYEQEGFLSDALFNYLALLGWSLDGQTTLMSRELITTHFSLDRISKNPAVFDPEKLAWMNQVYLKEMGAAAFVAAWEPYLLSDGLATSEEIANRQSWFESVYPLVVERIHTLSEVNEKVSYLLSGNYVELDEKSQEKCLQTEEGGRVLQACLSLLSNQELSWNTASIESALRTLPEQLGLKPKVVFQTIRVAISGNMVSLPLFESMELIGKEACLARIERVSSR
ncbi:MAG: glutamate--tRNA ligase [Coriobacteriia bacterium]|nr:glutamate--tRNA ligase [Coriobacteriia bacterium]MCL2750024.1 glutamate--tRNA ligase [Coriobacteriia bacterium]